jgi:periplasmic protein TonB
MSSVYHPPVWGKKSWPGFLLGVAGAVLLFLLLPLVQYVSRPDLEEPGARSVDLQMPPPAPEPPPPPELPPEVSSPQPTARDRLPGPVQMEAPPLTLRQLQLALDPEMGAAGWGDFGMNFSLAPGGVGEFDVFEVGEVDQPPRAVSARPPRYPLHLQRAGITGAVNLVFIVNRDGSVEGIRVEHSDHRSLELPAIEAVRTWRFLPGEIAGEPARVMVRQSLTFEVQ